MVINLQPNQGIHILPGQVPGLMHVYCVGPSPATFDIAVANQPPPWVAHFITAGHMLTFQVDGLDCWVQNRGPSRIQLLSAVDFAGVDVKEAKGARPFDVAQP